MLEKNQEKNNKRKKQLEKRKYKTKEEEQELEKIELEEKIARKIKNSIIEKKSELEIINYQLYIIKENTTEVQSQKEIKEQQREIKKLLEKIDKLKSQIEIYINDKVIDDAILLDKKNVIDDILDYKKMIEAKTSFKEDYEIIEEYGIIVDELDRVNDKCIELDKEKNRQLEILNIDEERFDELETKTLNEKINVDELDDITKQQDSVLNEIAENVDKIDVEKQIEYNFEAFNKLMVLELKYIALLAISPLKGALPYIGIKIAKTKEAIDLLKENPLVTSQEILHYYGKDFTSEIENAAYKFSDIENMLNSSLENIENIKIKLLDNSRFKNNPKYDEIMNRIYSAENILKENAIRIDVYRTKLSKSKTKNKEKLEKIKTLNKK